jgi:peptide/nickel transport system substrate-binding protein
MAIVQQQLAEVGINVEPSLITGDVTTQLNARPTSTDANGISGVDWDIAYGALSAVSPFDYYLRFGKDNASNIATPYNEELEEYLQVLNTTADVDAQKEAFSKVETWYADNILYVPLYYQPVWVVTSDKVEGNVDTWGNPQYFWNWDIQNWTLN